MLPTMALGLIAWAVWSYWRSAPIPTAAPAIPARDVATVRRAGQVLGVLAALSQRTDQPPPFSDGSVSDK